MNRFITLIPLLVFTNVSSIPRTFPEANSFLSLEVYEYDKILLDANSTKSLLQELENNKIKLDSLNQINN